MMDEDTVMADAPLRVWSGVPYSCLEDGADPNGGSHGEETLFPEPHKSKVELVNGPEPATIDPSFLSHFPRDIWLDAPQLADEATVEGSPRDSAELPGTHDGVFDDKGQVLQMDKDPEQRIERTNPLRHSTTTVTTRRSRSNLPKSSLAVLKAWLQEHESNPYPSQDEKKELAVRSGLQIKQINYWFMNARKRILNCGYDSSASFTDTESLASSIPARGRSPQRVGANGRSSSTESLPSSYSQSDSDWSRAPKRGRKRKYANDSPVNNRKRSRSVSTTLGAPLGAKTQTAFQCTFCRMLLSEKAWRRHEETQHVPQVYWKCMATGPVLVDHASNEDEMKQSTCAFCRDGVEFSCPKDHRIDECLDRGESERVFHRKDNLKQHLRYFHYSTLDDRVARAWEVHTEDATRSWPCGFCAKALDGWKAREIHIAQHFREGATMDSWDLTHARISERISLRELDAIKRPPPLSTTELSENIAEGSVRLGLVTQPGVRANYRQAYIFSPCPHIRCEDHTTSFVAPCAFNCSWPSGTKHPLKVVLHCPTASGGTPTSFWLWKCEEQNSLVFQARDDETHACGQILVRYSLDSILSVRVLHCAPSGSLSLQIKLKQHPMVFDSKAQYWDDRLSSLQHALEFLEGNSCSEFAAWISTSAFASSEPHDEIYLERRCPFAP